MALLFPTLCNRLLILLLFDAHNRWNIDDNIIAYTLLIDPDISCIST